MKEKISYREVKAFTDGYMAGEKKALELTQYDLAWGIAIGYVVCLGCMTIVYMVQVM